MDKGDWIQLLMVVSVFMVLVILIYSYIMWPLWISVLLTAVVLVAAYLVSRLIKL